MPAVPQNRRAPFWPASDYRHPLAHHRHPANVRNLLGDAGRARTPVAADPMHFCALAAQLEAELLPVEPIFPALAQLTVGDPPASAVLGHICEFGQRRRPARHCAIGPVANGQRATGVEM